MDIIQDFIPVGRKNRPAHPMLPTYITVHETGNKSVGANAQMHARYLKGSTANDAPVSWHFTVSSEQIYQHLPVIESAFHAGDGGQGIGNRQSIGIEICVNSDGNFEKAKANAQWLIRTLMAERHIKIENVVQHNHWSGKNCPSTMRNTNTWKPFIDGIQKVEASTMTEQAKTWQSIVNKRGASPQLVVDGNFGPASLTESNELLQRLDATITARNVEIASLKVAIDGQKKTIAELNAKLGTANTSVITLTANYNTVLAKNKAAQKALV
jgi:N-acetylmuramoyl-L-alanine amidase CwlA